MTQPRGLSRDQGRTQPQDPTRLVCRGGGENPLAAVAGAGFSGELELGLGPQHGEDVGLRDGIARREHP